MSDRFSEISDKLAEGQTIGAKRVLTSSWRDAVPELPVRFAVILVRLDKDAVKALLKRMRKSKSKPGLKLDWKEDRIEVVTSRGKTLRIGDLPISDSMMMTDLGDKAKKYRPQLLQIQQTESGDIDYLAIELVRPETKAEQQATAAAMVSALEEIAETGEENIDLGF